MSESRRSKCFSSSALIEIMVPVFLGMLLMILLAVIIFVILSLFGVMPSAQFFKQEIS